MLFVTFELKNAGVLLNIGFKCSKPCFAVSMTLTQISTNEFFYHLLCLKAKLAETWCEHKFLIGGLGDFNFRHFQPFLAKLWQKN